jgi:MoaA/NifB/PqqE/SkfB family radical SAM enzyme|tara:strand:+ start:3686 stop:4900 length:1215 start_codon:yes stop_codon:yes gene_type:complete
MINEKNKQSWCVNAEHAMSGDNTGHTKICCMTRFMDRKISLGEQTIKENFNQPDFVEVREALANGIQHEVCRLCWTEEDSGRQSKRLRDNEKYLGMVKDGGTPFKGLAKLELNLGNQCNLKCRTCGPHSSSTWLKEKFDMQEKKYYKNFKDYAASMRKYSKQYEPTSPFWDDFDNNLENINQIDFYGGEPFMSEKMWGTLKKAVELDYAKNIELHYATNCTHWPDDVEIFREFRHLNLNFSIDGVGPGFNYMRYPGKWSEAEVTLKKAREFAKTHKNIHMSWIVTLSSINIHSLPEIIAEYEENYSDFGIYLNLVHDPDHYNMKIIPDGIRETIINRLELIPKDANCWQNYLPGIIQFLKDGTPDIALWNKAMNEIIWQDAYRNQSFQAVYPEYYQLIKDNEDE